MKAVNIIIVSLGILLAGCGRQEQILLILKTADNQFFVEIEKGVREELAKSSALKAELVVKAGQNEGDVGGQRAILDAQFEQGVANRKEPLIKALILTPSSSGADLVQQVRRFREANVPVILLDTEIDQMELKRAQTDYNLVVFTDNIEGGRLAAKKLVEAHTGRPCRVLVLNGVPDSNTARERRDGFVEQAKAMGCEVALEKTANWRREQAQKIVAELASTWTFTGIFAANDEMALGAYAALRQVGRDVKDIPIVGFDAIPEARAACREGRIAATTAQDPSEMGRRAVRAIIKYRSEGATPKFDVEKLPPAVVCG